MVRVPTMGDRLRLANRAARPHSSSNGTEPYFVSLKGGRQVELIEHARACGRENLPCSQADEPNDLEAAVQLEHERQHLDLAEGALAEFRPLLESAKAVANQLPAVDEISVFAEKANAEIERALRLDRRAGSLLAERELRRRDLRKFMRDKGLSREAGYPASRTLHLGIVCLLVVLESWANAAYFAGGNAFGFVGGALQAMAISAVNVGAGFCAGFFGVRHLHHRALGVRLTAALALIITGSFSVLFNLVAAHCRDLATQGVLNPRVALPAVLHDPLDLTLPSIALLATGLLAFGLAAWKGFRLDDPHPGFGEMDRRFRRARVEYDAVRTQCMADALGRSERIAEDCAPVLERCDQVARELQDLAVKAHAVKEHYETEREHIEDRCELPLRRYRDENRLVRTSPEPPYFTTYPRFKSRIHPSVMREVDRLAQAARDRQVELRAAVQKIALSTPERLREVAERVELHLRSLEAAA